MYRVKLNTVPQNGALRESGLEIPLADLDLGEPFQGKSILADYELRRMDDDKVMGRFLLKGEMALACSRCLKDFKQEAKAEFMVEFGPKPPEDANPRSEDAEDPGPDWAWIQNEQLPVGEEMRQELELLIPYAPLCREDCKGLCPSCGADRNLKDCGCAPRKGKNPFSDLNKLFDSPKEN